LAHVVVAPPSVAEKMRAACPEAEVMAEPTGTRGLYGAVNFAATTVSGWKWITYINDDDRLLPDFEFVWRRSISADEADVIYGDVDYLDAAGAVIAQFPTCRNPNYVSGLLADGIAPFTQQGTLISEGLWRRLGGFDPDLSLAADFDFWVRAAATGARFKYVRARVAGFRIHAGQLSSDVQRVRSEIASVVAREDLQVRWLERMWARLMFRGTNAPRIFRRLLRTGRLRTRNLMGQQA
jgi:hypothetical protein